MVYLRSTVAHIKWNPNTTLEFQLVLVIPPFYKASSSERDELVYGEENVVNS